MTTTETSMTTTETSIRCNVGKVFSEDYRCVDAPWLNWDSCTAAQAGNACSDERVYAACSATCKEYAAVHNEGKCDADMVRNESSGMCQAKPWSDWVSCEEEKKRGACDDNDKVKDICSLTCATRTIPTDVVDAIDSYRDEHAKLSKTAYAWDKMCQKQAISNCDKFSHCDNVQIGTSMPALRCRHVPVTIVEEKQTKAKELMNGITDEQVLAEAKARYSAPLERGGSDPTLLSKVSEFTRDWCSKKWYQQSSPACWDPFCQAVPAVDRDGKSRKRRGVLPVVIGKIHPKDHACRRAKDTSRFAIKMRTEIQNEIDKMQFDDDEV